MNLTASWICSELWRDSINRIIGVWTSKNRPLSHSSRSVAKMSAMNQIMQSFASLDNSERQTAMEGLSTLMRDDNRAQAPKKKKVNGFIGFRCRLTILDVSQLGTNLFSAYYSALFSHLQQKQRSPFMTILWKQDQFHNEWDMLCSTYSAIRSFLSDEGITLQTWISFAVGPVGIVKRENYMAVMGWTLSTQADGTPKLERASIRKLERTAQPMSGHSLFVHCVEAGLPITDSGKIIEELSGKDVMCVNPKVAGRGAASTQKAGEDGFLKMLKVRPEFAMSQLLQLPPTHPSIASGVEVFDVTTFADIDAILDSGRCQNNETQASKVSPAANDHDFNAMFQAIWAEADAHTGTGNNTQISATNGISLLTCCLYHGASGALTGVRLQISTRRMTITSFRMLFHSIWRVSGTKWGTPTSVQSSSYWVRDNLM